MPEFNAGAMENVGAVTFHDAFLFRDPPTEPERLTRAEVALHELAHMWFGDLVTMRWWDDLWLNESFATYLSFLALDEATRFSAAWQSFNGTLKPHAYREDQLVTTHPIAAEIGDTDEAELGFDGITYEKGASVLKQLVATIGREAFRDGIRTYFRRHAWGNATLADFLAALGDAAGRSLDAWAEVWLRTASLNTIETRWTEHDGRIASMTLHQTAPADHPTLRPHAMTIALVSPELGGDAITTQAASITGAHVGRARGHRATGPGVRVPQPSATTTTPRSCSTPRPWPLPGSTCARWMTRSCARWSGRRCGTWSGTGGSGRSNTWPWSGSRLPTSRTSHCSTPSSITASPASGASSPKSMRGAESHALMQASLDSLADGDTDDDRRLWLRLAIESAASPEDVATMLDVVAHPAPGTELPVDQDMRWQVAVRAASMGLPDAPELVALEAERDRSDRGQRQRIRAEVARPLRAGKDEAWRRIHDEGYGSDYLTRAALSGFQWHHQRDLLVPYREPFFEHIRGIYRDRDLGYARVLPDRDVPGCVGGADRPGPGTCPHRGAGAGRGPASPSHRSRSATTWSGRSASVPTRRPARSQPRDTATTTSRTGRLPPPRSRMQRRPPGRRVLTTCTGPR